MAAAFVVPNRRRVRFELTLRIIDLNNVPLVSGTSLVKWHLPSSTAAEHRGRTNKLGIHEHRVEYDYEKKVIVRLTVGKDGMLQECNVAFEVLQEYSAAGRGERIRLGEVKLNLAEYVDASENPTPASPPGHGSAVDLHEGVIRRYLMQDSKINSTLKIGIYMRHLEGTRDYVAPPLRTAPVFGGIAGIISHSETPAVAQSTFGNDADVASGRDLAPMSLTHANRELGESQDMYRRTLAAYLFSAPGELKADDAIEDIFAGGDGWGRAWRPPGSVRAEPASHDLSHSGTSTPTISHDSDLHLGKAYEMAPHHSRGFGATINKRHKHHGHKHKHLYRGKGEIDETEVRDDFRTWTVSTEGIS